MEKIFSKRNELQDRRSAISKFLLQLNLLEQRIKISDEIMLEISNVNLQDKRLDKTFHTLSLDVESYYNVAYLLLKRVRFLLPSEKSERLVKEKIYTDIKTQRDIIQHGYDEVAKPNIKDPFNGMRWHPKEGFILKGGSPYRSKNLPGYSICKKRLDKIISDYKINEIEEV